MLLFGYKEVWLKNEGIFDIKLGISHGDKLQDLESVGKTRFRRDIKKTKFTQSYERQEIVESNDYILERYGI